MLLKSLINEYNLRSNIINYKKLNKRFLYNRFEKNNYNLIFSSIQETINTLNKLKGDYIDTF